MSNVADSLKKKLGPLPVWAWAIIAGIGLYYFRSKGTLGILGGSSATNNTGTPTDTSATGTATPQPPTVLSPGESAYDPNTGALVSNPSGDTSGAGSGGSADTTAAIADLGTTLAAALSAIPTANEGGTTTNNYYAAPAAKKPPVKKVTNPVKKPPIIHKKKAKPKEAHKPPLHKTPTNPAHKAKARSTAAVHSTGHSAGHPSVPSSVQGKRTVKPTASTGSRLRASKPKVPILRPGAAKQHVVATHPVAHRTPTIVAPHRPSAPPPRTSRPAPKPPPKPPVRKR